MKYAKVLVALMAFAVAADVATATTTSWWTLGTHNALYTASQSGQGLPLYLNLGTKAAGTYDFVAQLNTLVSGAQDFRSHSMTVTNTSTAGVGVTGTATILAPFNVAPFTPNAGTLGGGGGMLLYNFGTATLTGPGVGPGTYANWTVPFRITIPAGANYGDKFDVVLKIQAGWVFGTPNNENRSFPYFGTNHENLMKTYTASSANTVIGPMIAVNLTPEPSTLVLLGLGFVGLLRRR